MIQIREQLQRSWVKNGPDFLASCSGRLRRLLSAPLPIFVFHSVEPQRFERQLRFLADNGYSTITGDSLLEILEGKTQEWSKSVVLTFDDATGSFWSTAYPLLKKYGFRAILFAIPGLVPEDVKNYPNLKDVWKGRVNMTEILQRESVQPLCTWRELQMMHESEVVDIQSHSLTHSRIFISAKIVDFLHPDFDTYFYENVQIPVTRSDSCSPPVRPLSLGQPVYRSASRFCGRPRYLENIELSAKMITYVNEHGGEKFFESAGWRRELAEKYRQLEKICINEEDLESLDDARSAIHFEMMTAKTLIEEKLPGKTVQHFCYPWYEGSSFSDAMAFKVGYQVVYYGFEVSSSQEQEGKNFPIRVSRIPDDFLCCLPGKASESILNVWIDKVWRVCWRRKKNKLFYTSAGP